MARFPFMSLSIRDLARQAGVCIGTVSRVLNNKDKVHPHTRARIQRLIAETGYRPSARGRALALQRSQNVLLVVPNLADPYCALLSRCVHSECHQAGFRFLLGDSEYHGRLEAEYLQRAQDGSVDGLLLSPVPTDSQRAAFRTLKTSGLPVVLVDNDVPEAGFPCVKYDDFGGARQAVRYLFERGHRRMVFVGWRMNFQTVRDRLAGFRAGLIERGLAWSDDLALEIPEALTDWSSDLLRRLLRRPRPPTALLAENELVAVLCLNALLHLRRRIPREVAVMAFGDSMSAALLPVPLTTMKLDQPVLARRAMAQLRALIEKPALRQQTPRTVSLPLELVVRKSA